MEEGAEVEVLEVPEGFREGGASEIKALEGLT